MLDASLDAGSDAFDVPAADAGASESGAPGVRFIGRFDMTTPNQPSFEWSASAIEANFTGPSVAVQLGGSGDYFAVVLDGVLQPTLVTNGNASYPIAGGLAPGVHDILVFRRDEAHYGAAQFRGFDFGSGGQLLPPPPTPDRRIELVGDSISCGWGNECSDASMTGTAQTENEYLAYGPLAARAVGADLHVVAWSGKGMYRNGDGTTTETMPVLWQRTLPTVPSSQWDPSQWIPDVVVINLGTDDYRMTPDPTPEYQAAYLQFVTTLRNSYPATHILCTLGPMMTDPSLSLARTAVNNVIAMRQAAGDARISYLEFPMQNCGTTGTGCGCMHHPNTTTDQAMADVLVPALRSTLGW